MVSGVRGTTVLLNRVRPGDVRRIARYYWVRRDHSPVKGDMTMSERRQIGLAVVGCGTIGRIRAMLARQYPGVGWVGLCDLDAGLGRRLAADAGGGLLHANRELLARPRSTRPSWPPTRTATWARRWPRPSAVTGCSSRSRSRPMPENRSSGPAGDPGRRRRRGGRLHAAVPAPLPRPSRRGSATGQIGELTAVGDAGLHEPHGPARHRPTHEASGGISRQWLCPAPTAST